MSLSDWVWLGLIGAAVEGSGKKSKINRKKTKKI